MRRLGIKYRIIAKEVNAHGFFAHYLFFCFIGKFSFGELLI